jgi:hypothetical protein
MIVGCIFIMNLVITVIVDNFNNLNAKAENISLLTESQKDWIFGLRYFLNYTPIPDISRKNMSKFRNFSYSLVKSNWFNRCINIVIILNVLVMCIQFDRDTFYIEDIQSYMFYLSTLIFNIEIFLNIYSYRRFYFINGWNKFDFIVIIVSNMSIILSIVRYYAFHNVRLGKFDIFPVLIRGIRILRVIRLINLNKQVKDYFYTLIILFPSLYNLGSLVLINLIIFSVIGMNLFGTVMYDDIINPTNNFKNFISSFIFLIKVTTGDNWGDSMYSLARGQPGCRDEQTYEDLANNGPQGCGNWMSFFFFIVFLLFNKMVIMNLFIAVVVDTFVSKTEKSDKIDDSKVQVFFELWGKYDRQINYYIEPWEFVLLMLELEYPLGIKGDSSFEAEYDRTRVLTGDIHISHNNKYFVDNKQCIRILSKLNLISRDGKIHLIDAIVLVLKRALFKGIVPVKALEGIKNYKTLNKKLENSFFQYHKGYKNIVKNSDARMSSHLIAVKVISRFLSRWRESRLSKQIIDKTNT